MKNITLSADDSLIAKAREVARAQNTTLNDAFRIWLRDFTSQQSASAAVDALYARLAHVDLSGPKLTREQMNER